MNTQLSAPPVAMVLGIIENVESLRGAALVWCGVVGVLRCVVDVWVGKLMRWDDMRVLVISSNPLSVLLVCCVVLLMFGSES